MHAFLCAFLMLSTAATDASQVLDWVFLRQAARDKEIATATYRARLRYVETDLKSGDVDSLECVRVVTMSDYGDQTHDFGDLWHNGCLLEGEEREKELESLRSKGIFAQETLMPFFTETRDEYEYEITGRDTLFGLPVWRVEFTPIRETKKHIVGSALVLDDCFDIVSMEFKPSDLPFVVTDAALALHYGLIDGQWLPARFEMDMDLRLAIIIELMRIHVRIEEEYWDFHLTGATPDTYGSGD